MRQAEVSRIDGALSERLIAAWLRGEAPSFTNLLLSDCRKI
jgi:hypothetical protein